ncbi:MAG TPA: TonB-dependent receptor, partial [Nevskiaceae bacterium]|nr:TonB-dependent receptor [Nevskiaceae bacterium]
AATPAAAPESAVPAAEAPAAAEAPVEAPAPAPTGDVATIPVKTPEAEEKPASDGHTQRLDAIQVTGSRIRRTDYETAQPVTLINRDQIDRSGLTNIGDLLARISAAGASVNTTFATLALSGGETNLDLRNLGSSRVLVLVNGHRWVNGLNSTGTSAVDLNNIPTSIIDHIEVLKDGASAIYGSDAIAGVVNIITRKDYDGQEVSAQYGAYEQGDGAKSQYTASFGRVLSSTSVFANFTYSQEDVVKTTTRAISAYPGVGAGTTRLSSIGPNGLFEFIPDPKNGAAFQCPNLVGDLAAGVLADPAGNSPVALPFGLPVGGIKLPQPVVNGIDMIPAGLQLCELIHNPKAAVDTYPLNYRTFDPTTDGFNRYQDSNLQNPSKRGALFMQVKQEILDNLNFTFEGLYDERNSESQLRPQALEVGDLAGLSSYVDQTQMYNPFGQNIGKGDPVLTPQLGLGIGSGVAALRLTSFPPVVSKDRYKTLRLGGDFDGTFDVLSQTVTWDVGYSHSYNHRREDGTGDLRADHLALALGPASACTGDCVAADIFHGNAGLTPAMINYLALYRTNHTKQSQEDAYGNVSTEFGALPLPGGPVALAAGVEYRHDEYSDDPDWQLQQGLSTGNNSVRTQGSAIAKEMYAELGLPLLKNLPAIETLELSLAARHSIYRGFGGTNTGKAGIRWKPVNDLLLRGTYSTAFRAPSVGELFLGDSDSFETVTDPCATDARNQPNVAANCTADGVSTNVSGPPANQLRSTVGGNQQLRPETARTLTYGLVFEPSFVPNLNITVDYYRIKLKNIIAEPGDQFIIDSCYDNSQRAL